MRSDTVIIIDGEYYKLRQKDDGFLHPEDRGLWRAGKVEWDRKLCFWNPVDDEDYMIAENRKIVAKEYGWDLRREVYEL